MSGFNGFPGQPGAPGPAGPTTGFTMMIPPDPSWEPFETTDTLEMDGFFACVIKQEKPQLGEGKTPGVFFTLMIHDEDCAGKTLSKLMPDARNTTKDVWWIWRSLLRSIYNDVNAGKNGINYVAGMFSTGAAAGQVYCYVRTEPYADKGGDTRTGVAAFVMRSEWEEAKKAGGTRYRWPSKPKAGTGSGAMGALPGGLPASFPGAGSAGLPGAPSASTGAGFPMSVAPAPSAAPPLQQVQQAAPQMPAAPTAGFPAAPTMAPTTPFAAPPVATSPFSFPAMAPTAPPPPAGPSAAPSPPTANGFPGFPGGPTG